MTSIRAQLSLLVFGLFALALFLAAIFVLAAQRGSLESALDSSLETRADDIVALLEQGLQPDGLGINSDEDTFAMVVGPDGDVITTTDRFGDPQELVALDRKTPLATVRLDSFSETSGTEHMRIAILDGPTGERVFVGESIDRIDRQVANLRTTLLITSPLLALAAASTTAFAVSRAFRPVEAMRAEADQISLTGLNRRLPQSKREDEIGQLSQTFNAMLERLQLAAASQQQLTADMAHELRSPITAIATLHEVDLTHPDRADWEQSATEALDETKRLQRLIDNLLFLSSLDGDHEPVANDLVDLDEIIHATINRLQLSRDINIDRTKVSAGLVHGNAIQLEQVIRNIIDNAIRHAESSVTITLSDDGSLVELIVANDGDTIDIADTERIFDRFYRTQHARDRHTGGTGLGLAIAKAIISDHDGTITANPASPGSTITVQLPPVP